MKQGREEGKTDQLRKVNGPYIVAPLPQGALVLRWVTSQCRRYDCLHCCFSRRTILLLSEVIRHVARNSTGGIRTCMKYNFNPTTTICSFTSVSLCLTACISISWPGSINTSISCRRETHPCVMQSTQVGGKIHLGGSITPQHRPCEPAYEGVCAVECI